MFVRSALRNDMMNLYDKELQAPLLQPSLADQVKSLKQQRALLWTAVMALLAILVAVVLTAYWR